MATKAPIRPAPTRAALGAVLTATFFVRFAFGITLAIFAIYLAGRSTGLTGAEVAVAGSVSALAPVGEFSTVLFSGAAADRWGRFPVLFGGMGGSAILFVAISRTRGVLPLAVATLVFGVASGAILAASLAVIADHSATNVRGYEMGRFDAMNLFGWIAGYAFGIGVAGALPNSQLDLVFLAGAAAILVGLLAGGALARGELFRPGPPTFDFGRVLRNAFRSTVLVVTLPWLAIYSLLGTALVFLKPAATGLGIDPQYLALAIAGGGAILVVSQPYFGRLADRTGRTRMMTVGAAGFVLVLLCASLLARYGVSTPLLVGIGLGTALALAYGPAALAALADLATEQGRATTMAIYSLTISLGMFLGLIASTALYGRYGTVGLYPYFGAIAAVLVGLTALRWVEAARARIPVR